MSFSIGFLRLVNLRSLRPFATPPIFAARASSTVVHDIHNVLSVLEQKLESRSISGIHVSYPALVAALKQTGVPSSSTFSSPLSKPQLLTLLEVLASSGRPADLQRIEQVLQDMPSVFGVEPTHDFHTVIIRGLINHGNIQTIHRWLFRMPSCRGHLVPTHEQFHMFLEACLHLTTFRYMRHIVKTMRRTGCKPTAETFKYLVRARWIFATQEGKSPHVIAFSNIFDDMAMECLSYNASFASFLREKYEERGLQASADQVQTLYESRFLDLLSPEQLRELKWTSWLARVAQSQGLEAAIKFMKSSQFKGRSVSPLAIRAMLRHSRTTDDLDRVLGEFGVDSEPSYWSLLINNNVRDRNISAALLIYEKSKNAGIVPCAASVGPLIKSLCWSVGKSPSDESVDRALAIYHDLVRAAPSAPASPKQHYLEHSSGPDIGIYHDLLRGLSSGLNNEKHYPAAKALLADMEDRKISTINSNTASSLIVLCMRRAQSLEDALDAYCQLRSSLDERGYAVVLNVFCSLTFGDTLKAPPLKEYFEIVKDMRRAGLEITVEVYTILLHRLGKLATQLRDRHPDVLRLAEPDLHGQLLKTTRQVHDFMTLDAAVSPDAVLWNQLMDTYQRMGCFGDALRVWDTMYFAGRFDHISVSIVLDACGFAGSWPAAKKVCKQLFDDRFAFNLHNWNTWIECLCRLGRLNDAVKVVCMEMGKNQVTVEPDVESAGILIKFAKRDGLYDEVAERLQRHVPKLWETLPDDSRRL